MSNPLRLESILRALEQLRDLILDFSKRLGDLDRRLQKGRDAARFRTQDQASQSDRLTLSQRDQAEADHQATLERLVARHQQRSQRIRDALRNARKRRLERVEAREGRQKFELQRTMLQATRDRDSGFASADAALAAFESNIQHHHQHLSVLEHKTREAFALYGRGFLAFLTQPLSPTPAAPPPDPNPSASALLQQLEQESASATAQLTGFRTRALHRLVALWPLWWVALLLPFPAVPALHSFQVSGFGYREGAIAAGFIGVLGVILYAVARSSAASPARHLAHALQSSRRLQHAALAAATQDHQTERARIESAFDAITQQATNAWNDAVAAAEADRSAIPPALDAKAARSLARADRLLHLTRDRLLAAHTQTLARLDLESSRSREDLLRSAEQGASLLEADHRRERLALESEWSRLLSPILDLLHAAEAAARAPLASVALPDPRTWTPPASFADTLRLGELDLDLDQLAEIPLSTLGLPFPAPLRWTLPACLTFPDAGSLHVETRDTQRAVAQPLLNRILLRLLAEIPPGRIALNLVDPIGLGQGFAALMHLADDAEHLIHGRIWTQTAQIEERLEDLNDHVEKVIQMYLRNEFRSIAEYNAQAGSIAEKYHFLVIADFPHGFSDLALRRLRNLAASGPRCGVFTLMHWDLRASLPQEFPASDLRADGVLLSERGDALFLKGRRLPGVHLRLDPPADPDTATALLRRIARASIDSNRIEVPFDQVAPTEPEVWSWDTLHELRVPIGRTGATKLQLLALGKGTRQHALVAGKTGSGKSTLFHVIITNLALWCSPDEIEFYLVDFKKGVEFKCYASHRLPHARVVAIESDREFGLSVLQRLDQELKRRGDLFRAASVQDITGYRRQPGAPALPRVLLLIDEFQEFFVEEDRIAQNAAGLLDRIVRQGRAFGIHVILGSQTLGGAYTVARSTLGQMVVRIALQCNEADAHLIMDEENAAPRLLTRPGEGIYNDAAGAKTGNSPFQVVWLPDQVRDSQLRHIRQRALDRTPHPPAPFVFEGDAPADIREHPSLDSLFTQIPSVPPESVRLWLGAPNAIKGPTEVRLDLRTGSHLLVVGQRDDASLALLTLAWTTLTAQFPPGSARFFLLDPTPSDSTARQTWDRILAHTPHPIQRAGPAQLSSLLAAFAEAFGSGADSALPAQATRGFLFIPGLEAFRALRQEDEFSFSSEPTGPSPVTTLRSILADGASRGFHVIASCDTYGNLTRAVGRKGLSDFESRVLFQMSPNDSASLIDSPHASRLGLHRALLHREREAEMETFRPYAMPDSDWWDHALASLQARMPPPTSSEVPIPDSRTPDPG